MEKSQHVPQKSHSFSSSTSTAREKLINRNLSLGAIRHEDNKDNNNNNNDEKPEKIDEGEEEPDNAENQHVDEELAPTAPPDEEVPPPPQDLATIIQEVDRFLAILLNLSQTKSKQDGDQDGDNDGENDTFPEIPESIIEKFAELVEIEITKLELGEEKLEINHPQRHKGGGNGNSDGDGDGDGNDNDDDNNNKDKPPTLLEAIERMSKLTSELSPFSSNPTYFNSMSLTGTVLHRAMSFFEDEFYSILDEASKPNNHQGNNNKTKKSPSSPDSSDPHVVELYYPSTETLTKLKAIADSMISTGYGTECYQVFLTTRRNALRSGISDHGFEKIAIDDIQKMAWDSLETEIANWVKTFEHVTTVSLPLERELCTSIFGNHVPTAVSVFTHLALHITHMFLNFAEGASMTKRAAEKLFKMLDIYEALRNTVPKFDAILPDLKPEISALQSRLGETAISIFCELENSIKSDVGKNAVPGGAVHPLTRYVMNYLKYAGEYINTLEQIFKDSTHMDEIQQQQKQLPPPPPPQQQQQQHRQPPRDVNSTGDHSPFEIQLIQVMDLLQSNLESKAKLYKELGLKDIFLMNNVRYIVQKIKGSAEINKLLGNTWCRKRSSDLRQYHKNYQRDTWSKVLACFKEEGLQVKGSVLKPVLKERFKSFNAQFEEIHKMQSMWVVSDEQLQSELRVSISAVVVPAYRSFLGRFSQYFTAGRQTEKYVKFGSEEVESLIDELFDGNPSSMVRRRT